MKKTEVSKNVGICTVKGNGQTKERGKERVTEKEEWAKGKENTWLFI